MSRGPKPPIAPKPKLSADTESRSSVNTNNNLNKCSNCKLLCLDGELCDGNQCSAECPEAEADDEYIVLPETQLTNKDCNDLEHKHDQSLDSFAVNEVLEIPEEAEKEEDNIPNHESADSQEIKHHNFSDIAEPIKPDSVSSTRDRGQSEAFCEELSDATGGNNDVSKNVDEDKDVAGDCSETRSKEETSNNLKLVKDSDDSKTDGDNILNRDEGDVCGDIILTPLTAAELIPSLEKSGEEKEEELSEILGKGDRCPAHDGDHSVYAELDLNMQDELENDDCTSPDMLPNEASEKTVWCLELPEGEPNAENGLGDSTHQAAAEEEEADTDKHNNTNTGNVSDDCQITDLRGEETSEVACEASKDSGKREEETVNAESINDGCQIAPSENDDGEEVPTNRQTEETCPEEDGQISDTLPSGPGMETKLEDMSAEEHNESIAEMSKSDELQLEGNKVETDSLSKSDLSPTQLVPCKEEIEVCKHGKMNVKHRTKNVLHEKLALPEVVIVPEESERRETGSDSLDDPYVLPAENEFTHKGQTDSGADHSKRDELDMDGESNLLLIDRKSIVTRTRSLSGRMPGYVPETVPEEGGPETDLPPSCNSSGTEDLSNSSFSVEGKTLEDNKALPSKPRHFILYPRSYSVEGREIPISIYKEGDGCVLSDIRMKKTEDNLSLPCVNGSSHIFSQGNLSSGAVSTPSSVVDIPPPFELAYITKKPITKSSPSLLIENESPDKYSKKKKSSFKRFLTLKFKKKTENKIHVDVNVSSSRSSSESSYHGPPRLMELDRTLSSSPQLKSHVGKLRASESPSTVFFYKDGKRKGTPKSFSRSVSRVESFEDRSRPPFMPLPLTKPRSISFPNADTSEYENIPAMSSDYENIQIPPRRSTRAGTFTEFFEDPSRALSAANENDGYVDMSSFTGFENKQQTTDQETERYCNKLLCKTC